MIPYGRQSISDEDIKAVEDVLRSDWLTQGPAVPRFEQALCAATGAEFAVAANSATSALHAACLALGLGEGGLLWTSPNTFVASANCGLYCGADVDFVDIDPATRNMSVAALAEKLAATDRVPDIVIPVAFSGRSAEMDEIAALAKQYGFAIIEDASHAIGGCFLDAPIGCNDYADITIFSFHPVKIVTTAEGGAALTNSAELEARLRLYCSHGVTRDPDLRARTEDPDPWSYDQIALGYNYRMTDLQAALGASQMTRLSEFNQARAALARRYDMLLQDLPVNCPVADDNRHQSGWHLYVIELERGINRRGVFEAMRDAGIGVNVHYQPVHTQPYYLERGFAEGDFPNAEAYYAQAISLPLYASLTEAEQDQTVQALADAIDGAMNG